MPFGASISCAVFQAFSDALAHILNHWNKEDGLEELCLLTNYLDDFLFISYEKEVCDRFVFKFIKLCNMVGCPIAEEKTEWGCSRIVFLGILLDGKQFYLAVPDDKDIKLFINLTMYCQRKLLQ